MKIYYDEHLIGLGTCGCEHCVADVDELIKWILGLTTLNTKRFIHVPIPTIYRDCEPTEIKVEDVDRTYYIHMIVDSCDNILFSDGELTGGCKFWNNFTKEFCRQLYNMTNLTNRKERYALQN